MIHPLLDLTGVAPDCTDAINSGDPFVVAMRFKRNGTWHEVGEEVILGSEPNDGVLIRPFPGAGLGARAIPKSRYKAGVVAHQSSDYTRDILAPAQQTVNETTRAAANARAKVAALTEELKTAKTALSIAEAAETSAQTELATLKQSSSIPSLH